MEVTTYGREKLPAGPGVEDGDEIIIVEGRADVINLLKHGIKNAIAINGTSVPTSIVDLCSKRVVTVFVDGDRGGDLIIRELLAVVDVDFVTKAPNGMEVEEITKKEIFKALRSKVSPEQAKTAISKRTSNISKENTRIKGAAFARGTTPAPRRTGNFQQRTAPRAQQRAPARAAPRAPTRAPARAPARAAPRASSGKLTDDQKASFGKMLEDLIGTRGAYLLDNKSNILGKVPFTELVTTIKSLSSGIFAVVFDGVVEEDLMNVAGQAGVKYLIGMGSKVKGGSVEVLTAETLA
jgi:DNA primase